MNNKIVTLLIIFFLVSGCKGQDRKIISDSTCSEYFNRSIMGDEKSTNTECANLYSKGDFRVQIDENNYFDFSLNKDRKLDKKIYFIRGGDTIFNALYKDGKVIEEIIYNGKEKAQKRVKLDDGFYVLEISNNNTNLTGGDLNVLNVKTISTLITLEHKIVKINYKDKNDFNRYVIDYSLNNSSYYDIKGILREETENIITHKEIDVSHLNEQANLGNVFPALSTLNTVEPKQHKIHTKIKKYNELGKIINSTETNINEIKSKNIETYFYYTGDVRKKVISSSKNLITTTTYSINGEVIKNDIKRAPIKKEESNELIEIIEFDEDIEPEIMEIKN